MINAETIEQLIKELKAACIERDIRPSVLASDLKCTKQWITLLFSGKYHPKSMDKDFINNSRTWLNRCRMCGSKWKSK
jgi:hypothetical protein